MKRVMVSASVILASVGLASGCATGSATTAQTDLDALAQQTLRESFLPGPGQYLSRLNQDEAQKLCTQYRGQPPASVAESIQAKEKNHIAYPADGKLMGDWKEGAKVFNGGFAYRIGHFIPSNPKAVRGGNCYACHQGEAKEVAYGNLGPSLLHYGKLRGTSDAVVRYTYEKIYNAKAYNACSQMPRLGHHGILSPKQVADLTAYLLSPQSPINQ
ncbi:MAG: sulfur oxidation c-type cytochrome SoxX [Tepidimonas sp.]|uniref:sulfur oxidation c-type cytochrome SoxX n=1 Tax=Tepidimonas sp. TaxID=2002775 RepID=UPI00259EA942|nr:sulfur oxidation c-type cytochrome SoxX [Tepidimonas sp.]MDM7457140.1 sulfur oxidation c-type cytochrome SoxX [Tepidimonas sp.]